MNTSTISELQAVLDAEVIALDIAWTAFHEAKRRYSDALDAVIDAEDAIFDEEDLAPRPLPDSIAAAKRAVKQAKSKIPRNMATRRSHDPKIRAACRNLRRAESDLHDLEMAARLARTGSK